MQVRAIALTVCLALAMLFIPGSAHAQYQVTNLVSNQENTGKTTDPLIVNAWGLTYGPGGPFWISDNLSGWSTLYTSTGTKVPLDVFIPTAGGDGPGSATGIDFNGSTDFKIKGSPAVFIFATLDGTISGWAPSVNRDAAIIAVNNPGASYTGLAISAKPSGNVLLAVDNANNKVNIYNAGFKLVKSFTDTTLPAGFAAFGIQDFGGLVYVSFASSSGAAGGFIDIFDEDGTLLKQLAKGAPLNQAWGFAVAPKNFGEFSNTLLVSNNTNTGTINAFNAVTGQFVGTLKDVNGEVIHIDQLWGIKFGDGTGANGSTNELFFTAGPDNNFAGLFGVIVSK
ncbi:MAG: TIGR03118 family protein [Candidatus Acidiferrales bacterium]